MDYVDFCSFLLGVSATLIVLITYAEIHGNKKSKEPLDNAKKCIETYESVGNTDFLREARKQLEIKIWREERKLEQ